MQHQRLAIQILAIFALFSATLALDPRLEFNTTLLCTERYWLEIKFEGVVGNKVYFAGGNDPYTRYLDYTLTSESGSVGLYIVYDPTNLSYFAQMVNSQSQPQYQITLDVPACTGLTTTGLPASKQAVWVADVFRKDTDNEARGFYWNSNLQAAADAIFSPGSTVCDSAANFNNGGTAFLQSKGYSPTSAYCLMVTSTSADAGGLIQSIPSFLSSNWGVYDEVGFAQNITARKWVMILARRQRPNCGNKFRAVDYEECDDGNKDNLDGCNGDCEVESGWTCSENVLEEGSTCVQGPIPPTAPVPVPIAVPVSTPQGQTPTPGTPTASPTSAPTTAPSATPTSTPQGQTPTAGTPTTAPSATPSAAPQGNTPTGQTPTGQTPTGQTPTGQTPTGQTPSSSPQAGTPSTSSPSATPVSETPTGTPSASPSSTPDGGFTPSDAPSTEPFSPRPSRTPSTNIVNGSEKITASLMVIVTMLPFIIAF
jgi:cysteine-rich repeat protein